MLNFGVFEGKAKLKKKNGGCQCPPAAYLQYFLGTPVSFGAGVSVSFDGMHSQ